MLKYKIIKASALARKIEGTLYGPDNTLREHYTFLGKAKEGDVVIRHWIDEKGIQISKDKGLSALITQDPHGDAIKVAEDLDFTLIVTDNIEYATALAINHTVESIANDSFKVAITGTNGKSTTTHILYTIFNDYGCSTYTNTDALSEGNTLIDPKVASELPEFYEDHDDNIDVITLEVSEVQGWDDRLMENHSYQMISALEADCVIVTNVSMDHINLVKDFNHIVKEVSGAARALEDQDKKSLLVLNYKDENVKNMSEIVEDNSNVEVRFFGDYDEDNILPVSYKNNVGIYSYDDLYIKYEDLPFTSEHFIQDIMAAIVVCEYKDLDSRSVIQSLRDYKPLSRRFIQLRANPLIIDDFAHNPSGIKHTIENGATMGENLFIVNAIRGSRGESINKEIANALVESLIDKDDYTLILTCSADVVNHLNTVLEEEKEAFLDELDKANMEYKLVETLEDALLTSVDMADDEDVILLLGAQGMDPASGLLAKNNII